MILNKKLKTLLVLAFYVGFTIAIYAIAVSYTHLDVYKRQDGKRLRNAAFKHLSDQNFTIQPFGFTQSIYTCLLYTSRCV